MRQITSTIFLTALMVLVMGSSAMAQRGGPHFRMDDEKYLRAAGAPSTRGLRSDASLPAEWTGLAGVRSEKGMLLRWSTSSERGSAWFKIECRKAGAPEWQVVDILPAAGESSTPRYYSWIHANPPEGAVEYRLRQIDREGEESSTGELRVESAGTEHVSLAPCSPNPANAETLAALSTGMELTGSLVIVDLAGKIRQIVFQKQDLLPGSYRFRIGTASLPAGNYLLRLTTSEGVSTQRLLVTR